MILIQSSGYDRSTTDVIRWLNRLRQPWVRVNNEFAVDTVEYDHAGLRLVQHREVLALADVTAYWYRRGMLRSGTPDVALPKTPFNKSFLNFHRDESGSIVDLLEHTLHQLPKIGSYRSCINVNKNVVLLAARECGLAVPEFIITRRKEAVRAFLQQQGEIITKPLHSPFSHQTAHYWYPSYTEFVSAADLEKLPDTFGTSLFQKAVRKKFEIRTFFLKGKTYSAAIFSQRNRKTLSDFRKYDLQHPNRYVPFVLPEAVAVKITALMDRLGLESGSVDLIYTPAKEYVFLEVNPVGQYGMISKACNYQLDREVAAALIALATPASTHEK